MKQTIRLTESQFKKVITETIKKVLREQDENGDLEQIFIISEPKYKINIIKDILNYNKYRPIFDFTYPVLKKVGENRYINAVHVFEDSDNKKYVYADTYRTWGNGKYEPRREKVRFEEFYNKKQSINKNKLAKITFYLILCDSKTTEIIYKKTLIEKSMELDENGYLNNGEDNVIRIYRNGVKKTSDDAYDVKNINGKKKAVFRQGGRDINKQIDDFSDWQDTYFSVGKYSGKKYGEIYKLDRNYLSWYLLNVKQYTWGKEGDLRPIKTNWNIQIYDYLKSENLL